MASSGSYYINGPSLGSSTAIFLDANMTQLAPNGFYSDGVISREQINGVLQPQQTCPSCSTPCGGSISGSGGQGIYLLDLDAGATPADVGAIIVRFDPYSVPDGIRALFNGSTYNSLTSPVDGGHRSTNAGNYTFIGSQSGDCGISGTTYPALNVYEYNGTTFVTTGTTQSLSVSAGDVSLGVSAPGSCMLVIPKTTPTPNVVNFEFVGPCSGTAWNITVNCPVLLTGFGSSVMAASSSAACALAETTTYYNASLNNTPGTVGLYDFVYADAYGSVPLAAGFYRASGSITGSNDWFQVGANGVVTALGVCTGTACLEYTIWTTSGQGQTYTYTDCDGLPQSGNIGGASGYDANTFCAQENSVVGTAETTTVLNGACPPSSATLSWLYNETGGAISAMDLYVNGSIVESRSATSSGTYTVYEGDTINLEINTTACNDYANAYCTGIIIDASCDPGVTFLTTSVYTVTNADLGTTLDLFMYAVCDTACI